MPADGRPDNHDVYGAADAVRPRFPVGADGAIRRHAPFIVARPCPRAPGHMIESGPTTLRRARQQSLPPGLVPGGSTPAPDIPVRAPGRMRAPMYAIAARAGDPAVRENRANGPPAFTRSPPPPTASPSVHRAGSS